MKKFVSVVFLLITCNTFASDYKAMDGYSSTPLEEPVFEYAKVIVDTTAFNNWLNANYSKLDAQSMKGPREHLYYLLSSYVSELYKRDGVILPKGNDLVLETMLSWSERLGVYGAHLFYNKIKRPDSTAMPELMKVPEGIKISAFNDMYEVKSKNGGWEFKIPYYFMIGGINEFEATNGMHTQLLIISTGAVRDKTEAGRSQSTLMFVHSPSKKTDEFKSYWLSQFNIGSDIKPTSLGLNSLESFYLYDRRARLHKEVAFLPSHKGSYLVAYLGMDGAFQVNKQHYLDFLSQVNIEKETAANKSMQSTANASAD
ncbi:MULTISPECIES: hypothetical protein [Pseudidiomarina]|uniref:Uncharacterized protein n=2 Tax=Pseudidiomarina TaxID=2800384 RepID=A0A368V2K8_9GAMM|nr:MULTISPECIES: hypothetical protein [Pseudidiomarina]PWW05918.1 hypothetical protein DET45_1385 [Pseudidiomarina maritima]RBP91218.1 hypothetical protein DFO81_105169 [Pseudidiomarina tainanensis]RCW33231.1 hypothetical protein DFO79_105168 [Pseudidiomarina tainanensis]